MIPIGQQIEELTLRRNELWKQGTTIEGEVDRISKRLEDLYEERRIERARVSSGSRAEIVKRARIEVELERLMSEP